jgi:hypothetical protein
MHGTFAEKESAVLTKMVSSYGGANEFRLIRGPVDCCFVQRGREIKLFVSLLLEPPVSGPWRLVGERG